MQNRTNEELCALAREGNREARDLLLQKNLGLICQKACALSAQYRGIQAEAEDLIQEGCIAFLKAIPLFSPDRGSSFLTYAGQAAENAMMELIRSLGSRFEAAAAREGRTIVSLYEPLREEGYTERIQLIADEFAKTPEQILIEKETCEEIHRAMEQLSPRENGYLVFRFGFDAEDTERPLTVTADHFHLSYGRAGQIERSALKNVRRGLPFSSGPHGEKEPGMRRCGGR